MADSKGEGVKVDFDGSIRLEFHGANPHRSPIWK